MKSNISNYFKGKKVLITGHNGFKGSWLTIMLHLYGAKIYGISLKEKKNSIYQKANLRKILKRNINCNIENKQKIKKHIKNINPEIIIHLAAQSLVLESHLNPYKTYMTNVIGTLNILDAAREVKNLKKILITTTDKVYNILLNKTFNETDEIKGIDPYSSSKVCSEHLIYSFKKTYFNKKNSPKLFVARSGNVIGGGDVSKNRIIPDILKSIKYKSNLNIRDPESVRPWQHVLDPLYGYLTLISKSNLIDKNYIWNFGPHKKNFKKVIDIVNEFSKEFKFSYKFIYNQFNETKELKINSFKANKILGWKTELDLYEAIFKIIEFEKLVKNKISIFRICVKQINDYKKKINKKNEN